MSKTKNQLTGKKSRNQVTDATITNSFKKRFKELTEDTTVRKNLANELKVTETAIGQYRDGNTFPKTSNLIQIAHSLHCSLDYLIGQSDVFSPDADIQSICRYTGLCEEAVKVLHFISSPPENMSEDDAAFNLKTLLMLNLILETEAINIVGPQNEVYFKNVLSDMYNYIHAADSKNEMIYYDDGSIPEGYSKHFLFREMYISQIRNRLNYFAEKNKA